jgi:transposase
MAFEIMYRKRAVEYMIEEGHTESETAKVCKVGTTSLKRWKKDVKNSGLPTSKYDTKNRKPRKLPEQEVRAHVKAEPDALIKERAAHFGCSRSGMSKALRRYNITKKKDAGL